MIFLVIFDAYCFNYMREASVHTNDCVIYEGNSISKDNFVITAQPHIVYELPYMAWLSQCVSCK